MPNDARPAAMAPSANPKNNDVATTKGGTRRNLSWVRPQLEPDAGITKEDLLLLADAQTSGGLLVVGEVPGYPVIGKTTAGSGIRIR